ncbi:hypothetical protein CH298_00445 [Rhodococcoides fascians]|nr:hypothetical protein CH303_00445 [Rhodococcus fascians]OZF24509.1 hypothetical protein CH298_00445 [Rhodococcus fascians]OZF25419.1 hypothetical protein CH297_00445 [Rhodococcus fascians]OZF73429.1 hypothetical protein CH308_00445 [Rhodococcus fascians]OZF74269.1 hypothetical protein CH307_00445 [Rhodococcus fascians]
MSWSEPNSLRPRVERVEVNDVQDARGDHVPGLRAALARNLPMVVVSIIVLAALVLVLADRWRRGSFIFGCAAVVAALLRLCLPESRVGTLKVRSRGFDVLALGGVGGAIVFLSLSIDPLGTD